MSVYSFNAEDLEFAPLMKFSRNGSSNKKRTSSSTDVLLQIQNSGQIKPTPNQPEPVSVSELSLAPKPPFLFRPILRHSNSESSVGLRISKTPRGNYRSPQVFLQVRKYQPLNPDYLSKLSDELVLEIFRYLPKTALVRCAKTCRRFNRLSKDEILWKRVDLGGKKVEENNLHRLISSGVQVTRLARAEIVLENFDYSKTSFCRLQYLDFSMLVAADTSIVRGILFRCKSLLALSLEGCDIDETTCAYISRNPNIKFLNMALTKGITATGISQILRGCTNLIELHLGWTLLDREALLLACTLLPSTLLRLNISGCRYGTMDDDDLSNLTIRCPRLVEIDISDCTDLTSISLRYISENLSNLKILNCSRCYSIEPNAYTMYCKHLKELNILGTIKEESMPILKRALEKVEINNSYFSTIARPTVGIRRTSIWEQRVRDD